MSKRKKICMIGLIAAALCLTACGQKQGENPYGNTVAALGDEDAYAFLVMDCPYNVMVTSDLLYNEGTESQAAICCDVYYNTEDGVKNLGTVMGEGTAYPLAFSEDGIFAASGHSVEKYVISEGTLSMAKGVYERFDSAGNETYTAAIGGTEMESTESEYQEMLEQYAAAQIIHFSYGADGCVNEIMKP